MRPVSILIALAVIATLALWVFDRDALRQLAGQTPPPGEAAASGEAPAGAAPRGSGAQGDQPGGQADSQGEAPILTVVAMHSQAREIPAVVVLRGRTEASRRLQIRAETAGKLIAEPPAKGSRVSAGDVLCRIETGSREAAVRQAEAALNEAELNLKVTRGLSGEGFASATRLAAAQAAVEAARAGLENARRELERTTISAPFDGILEGEPPEIGSLMQPGTPCATLIRLDPIRMVGFVPELDVGRIEPDAPAGARLADGTELVGRVTFVSRSADPQTRTYKVELEAPNPDLKVRDGQSAEIGIRTQQQKAHLLPMSALTLNDAGDLGIRSVDESGTVQFLPVKMLRDSPEGVWVGGLPEKVDVIVVGQEYVVSGVHVNVSWREDGS